MAYCTWIHADDADAESDKEEEEKVAAGIDVSMDH